MHCFWTKSKSDKPRRVLIPATAALMLSLIALEVSAAEPEMQLRLNRGPIGTEMPKVMPGPIGKGPQIIPPRQQIDIPSGKKTYNVMQIDAGSLRFFRLLRGNIQFWLASVALKGRRFDESIALVRLNISGHWYNLPARLLNDRTVMARPRPPVRLDHEPQSPVVAYLFDNQKPRRALTRPQKLDILETKPPTEADSDGDGHSAEWFGGDDCDDYDPLRFPGNTEVADHKAHDEDCDPTTIGGVEPRLIGSGGDQDADGWIATDICNLNDDGTRTCGHDCDDRRADIHPHQIEVCNGRDDNCNGATDEELLNCPSSAAQ